MELKNESHLPVAQHRKIIISSVFNPLACDRDSPPRRPIECPEKMQKRALPCAACSYDGHHLTTRNLQIHTVEHRNEPAVAANEGLGEVYCFQHHHSCRIASTGNNLAACLAGYRVASAAISRLASTISATSSSCVATGR